MLGSILKWERLLIKTTPSKIPWGKVGHFEIYNDFDVVFVILSKQSSRK
jgi:hypothetical protein